MKGVFADTSYFIALLRRDDRFHQHADAISRNLSRPIFTSVWVLVELANAMAKPPDRAVFLRFAEAPRERDDVTGLDAANETYGRGYALFAARADKSWSLTDCISFVAMEELGITEALTADHHFEQAGFLPLLLQATA